MTTSSTILYSNYQEKLQQITDIKYAMALLQWDQETYMPIKGADARARQVATLSELAHQLFTSQELTKLIMELSEVSTLTPAEKKNIELSHYDLSQQQKLSGPFVRKLSEASSRCFQSWIDARKANDFRVFEKQLTELVTLKKQEADMLGYEEHLYNALLNQFERGATVNMLDKAFDNIRKPLQNLLSAIADKEPVNDDFLFQHFPREKQWRFGMELLKQMGFDFEAGRQDISEHPFTTNFSSRDVRITTRVDEYDLNNMTWSCIHELGHALYEQGLPYEAYGLPLGEYASLSIHESQSRLWENNVGRSLPCWEHFYSLLQQYFPDQLSAVPLADFYKAINKVQPSLIRTEADELTYHFHVMIRYEIEKQLLEGSIDVHDIPAYWNELYYKFLAVTVPDDKQGCLQDVHWSHGSFGYFPTYSLGSLYAAQFYQKATEQIDNLHGQIRKGHFDALLQWLRMNVHQYGRQFTSEALCEKITGEPLNIQYFMQYTTEKYSGIYSL